MPRKNIFTTNEEPDHELISHIHSLELGSVEEYRDWCALNGFSKKLKKHWKQRCRERFFVKQAIAENRLKQKKNEKRNNIMTLTKICEGRLSESDVTQPHLQRLCQLLGNQKGPHLIRQVNSKTLLRLLSHLHQCRAKFFDGSPVIADLGDQPGNTYIEALALVSVHCHAWLQPVEAWKPRSHSAQRQFASLLRHLFVQYDMPAFFDSIWFSNHTQETAKQVGWYLYVGKGQNIRNCQLPIPLTKKMAHHFMHAPKDMSFNQALRWGQILGMGGDERLARTIFGTRLAESFENDEFWATVIRWFVSHPMLDRAHVGPSIDYLHAQRFATELIYAVPGNREELPPLQPNLSMKGRSPESLLRQIDAWHRKLANDNRHQIRQWNSSGIEGFEYLEGSQKNNTSKCWTIRELLSSKSLFAEGRQLKHCVATYASSCSKGHSSIWTMEVESCEGFKKLITIEVTRGANLIRQARGKANRLPNEKEKSIIRRWAETANLKMASYV